MSKDIRGLFISFEGTEGAGKSTVINEVAECLRKMGHSIIVTREPGGVKLAEKIRHLLFETPDMDDRTEALLFAAARREHLIKKIIPHINNGTIVLCDRYIDSSLAYQGYARGLGISQVEILNLFAIEDYFPDYTFYLSLPVELGLQRIKESKNREINRLDNEKLNFHKKVQYGYEQLSKKYHQRYIQIDASKEVQQVVTQVCDIIKQKL